MTALSAPMVLGACAGGLAMYRCSLDAGGGFLAILVVLVPTVCLLGMLTLVDGPSQKGLLVGGEGVQNALRSCVLVEVAVHEDAA